jgi:phage/conjugal plasmid C-4 type zinc finger TraR family protein
MTRGPTTLDVSQDRSREARGSAPRNALRVLLHHRRHLVPPRPAERAPCPDLLELAQESEEELVWLAVLSRSREVREQVDAAAQRLAASQYGVCADCESPIPSARLQALPFAQRCLPCQEYFESRGLRSMAR